MKRKAGLARRGELTSVMSRLLGRLDSGGTVVAISGLLFVAIIAVRATLAEAEDATLVLFVLPVALCALEFGLRGGFAAALLSFLILVGWELFSPSLDPLGVATRSTAYLVVGGLLGRFVDERRAIEERIERHYDLSLDMFCIADFRGYFVELNPAWERTLGWTSDELKAQPFIEFVHPDDRERTNAESAKLTERGIKTVNFRNRYRTADGRYRWLEWTVQPSAQEGRLYATARDITTQREAEQALQNQSELLEAAVRARTAELEESRLDTLRRLALAAEYRDDDTQQHTERVGRTAALIARRLGLSEATVRLIRQAAPLHDIGKLGIPDAILLKPGKLTAAEFASMQAHTRIGAVILADGKFDVVRLAREIALSHHERWDGTGYPYGLAGSAIPIYGRIVAVADVFDALTHDRPYKRAWSVEAAVAEIVAGAGAHFDPDVVTAFESLDHPRLAQPVDSYDLEIAQPAARGRPADPRAEGALA